MIARADGRALELTPPGTHVLAPMLRLATARPKGRCLLFCFAGCTEHLSCRHQPIERGRKAGANRHLPGDTHIQRRTQVHLELGCGVAHGRECCHDRDLTQLLKPSCESFIRVCAHVSFFPGVGRAQPWSAAPVQQAACPGWMSAPRRCCRRSPAPTPSPRRCVDLDPQSAR